MMRINLDNFGKLGYFSAALQMLFNRKCLNFKIPDSDSLQGTNIVVDSDFGYDKDYDYLRERYEHDSGVRKFEVQSGRNWMCGGNDSGEESRCKSSQYTICPPQMLSCVLQSIICKSIPVVDHATIQNMASTFPNSRFFVYSYKDYINGASFSPGMVDKNMDIFLDQHRKCQIY